MGSPALGLKAKDVLRPLTTLHDTLDFPVSTSLLQRLHVLWRPAPRGLTADLVLKLAAKTRSRFSLTFKGGNFHSSVLLRAKATTPRVSRRPGKDHTRALCRVERQERSEATLVPDKSPEDRHCKQRR